MNELSNVGNTITSHGAKAINVYSLQNIKSNINTKQFSEP